LKKLNPAYLLFLSLLFFLNSCELINPSEDIPSYLHIDSFILQGNYDTVGTISENITDAWVFVDDQFIGAFELPVTLPILKKGLHKVWVKAGIKENGISNTRLYYPFYEKYEQIFDLKEKHIDTLRPVITYLKSGYQMPLYEDFESSNLQFDKSSASNINIQKTNIKSEVFEGKYSLIAHLNKKSDLFEMVSTKYYYGLPRDKAIFMEVNFKTNIPINVGYISYSASSSTQRTFVILNTTSEWKKIYLNLGNEIAFEPSTNGFKFFFGALKNTETDTSIVQLDNIKLLYLE
jgi:hypothetical protein